MNSRLMLPVIAATLLLLACTKNQPTEVVDAPVNAFADPQIRKIYEYQDRIEGKQLIPYLKSKEPAHRERAALAYASIRDTAFVPYLLQVAQTDETTEVRRAAVFALGQMRDSSVAADILATFHHELDYIGKSIALEALGKCADDKALEFLLSLELTDSILLVGKYAGIYRASLNKVYDARGFKQCREVLVDEEWTGADFYAIHTLFRNAKNPVARDSVDDFLATWVAINSSDAEIAHVADMWKDRITGVSTSIEGTQNGSSQYAFADMLRQKEFTPTDIDTLELLIRNESLAHIVRTTATEVYINQISKIPADRFIATITYCLHSGDMALQSLSANGIASILVQRPDFPYADSLDVIREIQGSLVMPEQMETYLDLGRLIAQIEDVEFKKPEFEYNHPIDWAHVQSIPADQQVRIQTSKGVIMIRLEVNDAPGSVSNFVKLIEQGFYNGKFFHRVVPNFVIQGGCPRGDGWGSLNWTQRSEFSNYLKYDRGAVGLASAGNDTEGVQFFITHIPTPHLDGRYSIFGYVVDGMDVVNDIRIGDTIEEITLVK